MKSKKILESGGKLEELSKSAQKKVEQYMVVKKMSNKVSIKFNTEACEQASKYHGYFVLIADKERNGEKCLERYRKREYIEEEYRNIKQHTDMNHVRCWDDNTLRGLMFVQFAALCYYEHFSKLIRKLKKDTKNRINFGEINEDERKLEQSLLSWIEKNSLHNQLLWFDVIEKVDISSTIKKIKWNAETTKRDKLYLSRLVIDIE